MVAGPELDFDGRRSVAYPVGELRTVGLVRLSCVTKTGQSPRALTPVLVMDYASLDLILRLAGRHDPSKC